MKKMIWILICCVWISTCGATEESGKKAVVSLPDGTTIELVGLRNYGPQDIESFESRDWTWWKPDGTVLDNPLDMSKGRTSVNKSYWFVVRVNGIEDCQLKAVGQLDSDLTVRPVQDKGQGFENDDLRSFTLKFFSEQQQADIKLGFTADDWKAVQAWALSEQSTPYNHFFGSSEGVIMRCPEQQGPDVVAEITQTNLDDATRLVVFNKEGQLHESEKKAGGSSSGLIRYIHRFRNLDINNVEHLEFQKKTYSAWITYNNVSLIPEHKTDVVVKIEYVNSLINKQFFELDNMQIDLSSIEFENKKILACFFDYQQRPSRNCILELSKRAEELESEDVNVIALHTSKIEQENLDKWIKENNISFPVGMISENEEQTRFNWGVQSLPWLILTDVEHIVKAEGFGLDELSIKIENE